MGGRGTPSVPRGHGPGSGGMGHGGPSGKLEVVISVPKDKCGLVIGTGGKTIRKINSKSGAECRRDKRPSKNPKEERFIIKGTREEIEDAQKMIAKIAGMGPPASAYLPTQPVASTSSAATSGTSPPMSPAPKRPRTVSPQSIHGSHPHPTDTSTAVTKAIITAATAAATACPSTAITTATTAAATACPSTAASTATTTTAATACLYTAASAATTTGATTATTASPSTAASTATTTAGTAAATTTASTDSPSTAATTATTKTATTAAATTATTTASTARPSKAATTAATTTASTASPSKAATTATTTAVTTATITAATTASTASPSKASTTAATTATTTAATTATITAAITTAATTATTTAATTTASTASPSKAATTATTTVATAAATACPSTSATTAATIPAATATTTHATTATTTAATVSPSTAATTSTATTAATTSSSNTFSKEITNALRVLVAIDQGGRPVMEKVLYLGTPNKGSHETLKHYLMNKKGFSKAQYKNAFDKSAQKVIDKDPTCKSFDISLLLSAIQCGCDNVAPRGDDTWSTSSNTLENHLKRVKDFRNITLHSEIYKTDQDFLDSLQEFRKLLIETLEFADVRYPGNSSQISVLKADIKDKIRAIKTNPLLDLKSLFKYLQDILQIEGIADLRKLFDSKIRINPASFIPGLNISLLVGNIFSALEIVEAGRVKSGDMIDHKTFLQYAHTLREKPGHKPGQVILIQGVAGVGKTTLIKMIISEWISNSGSVEELNQYLFIIPIECRSRATSSLSQHLASLMPTASKSFQNQDQLIDCLLSFKTMIIIDGLDEMNSESKKLVLEILCRGNTENLTIICTTRPEKVKNFYDIVGQELEPVHIKITGVPGNCTEAFVKRYHDELIRTRHSQQETDGLIRYLRTTGARLQEHWKLPFNLTLVTVLWSVDPKRVNHVTTPVELLSEIQKLTIEKLLERLIIIDPTKDRSALQENINKVLVALGEQALKGLRDDELFLQPKSVQHLRRVCCNEKLSSEEVLSAFMVQEWSWLPTSLKDHFSHPHKYMQEMFAANCIYVEAVDDCSQSNIVPVTQSVSILSILERVHEEVAVPLSIGKFQNTLIILLGLFYYHGEQPEEAVLKEIIDLLRQTGINDRDRWITVLNSIRCSKTVARVMIAQIPDMMKGILDIRDHNVLAYSNLMEEADAESVKIKISGNPSHIPGLLAVASAVARKKTVVKELDLFYLFRDPSQEDTPLMDVVSQILEKCQVAEYSGPWKEDFPLTSSMEDLRVSLTDSSSLRSLFSDIHLHGSRLQDLGVCLSAKDGGNFTGQHVVPIPFVGDDGPSLYLRDISDNNMSVGVDLIKCLQPIEGAKKFYALSFPFCSLSTKGLERFLVDITSNGTLKESSALYLPESSLPSSQESQERLNTLVKTTTGCSDGISWGNEDSLWW